MYISELFPQILLEKQEDIIKLLEPYRDDSDIYITFTNIPKVGINPNTDFPNTPAGIYVYPLKEIWKVLIKERVPFAGNRKFVQVLRANSMTEMSTYTRGNYINDINKILELYSKKAGVYRYLPDGLNNIELMRWGKYTDVDKPIGNFWALTERIATIVAKKKGGKLTSVWNSVLRSLGYGGFSDKTGIGLIHGDEPIQAVFLSSKAYSHVAMLNNNRDLGKKIYG